MPEITFSRGIVDADGHIQIVEEHRLDPTRCRFLIFAGEHYREDGSCRCDDPEHVKHMIRNWGYRRNQFDPAVVANIPVPSILKTLYTGSYGYRDCDAIGKIAALSLEACARGLSVAIADEESRSREGCDGDHDDDDDCDLCDPDIWFVGPFQESALEVLRGIRREGGDPREHIGLLRADRDGFVYA